MGEDELRERLEAIGHDEVIELLIELMGDDLALGARVELLLDARDEAFDHDDLAEDESTYDPGTYEREARECVADIQRVLGWAYTPRMAALEEMCSDLEGLASSVPVRRRPVEAVNTMMAVLRVVFKHRDCQEEVEFDMVAEVVLESLREALAGGHRHADEVLDELRTHAVEVVSAGDWDVHDGVTRLLSEQLTAAEIAGLCDQLGDEVDMLEPSSNQRRWRLEGVRRFCSALAPGLDLSAHLPED